MGDCLQGKSSVRATYKLVKEDGRVFVDPGEVDRHRGLQQG